MKTIKIISVRQPWAWLLVTDKLKPELQKDIENGLGIHSTAVNF